MTDQDVVDCFEDWYLSIPDADETLINKTNGCYTNETVISMFSLFKSGYAYGVMSR